jgi:hypothetical protein
MGYLQMISLHPDKLKHICRILNKRVLSIPGKAGKFFFIFTVLLLPIISNIHAQVNERNWSVGVHSGMLVFFGDVKTNDFLPATSKFNELRAGGGFHATYQLNPVLGLRGSLLSGKLAGAKPENDEYFEASFLDYTIQLMLNINTLVFYNDDNPPVDVYAILGYGLVEFRSIRRKLSDNNFIRSFGYNQDGSKSAKKTRELVLPIGLKVHSSIDNLLGIRNYYLSNTGITLEFILHNANTNKLDSDLTISETKDKYSYFALGLLYTF